MGQKVNPTIFRLGKTKQWKSQFFEKKPTEHSVFIYRDLEIKKFLFKHFKEHGLIVHNCRLSYLNNSLHIFVSYFVTVKTLFLVNKINKTHKVRLRANGRPFTINRKYKRKLNTMGQKIYNLLRYNKVIRNKEIHAYTGDSCFLTARKIIEQEKRYLKHRRLRFLQYFKKSLISVNCQNSNNMKNNVFLEKILESLTLFTRKKLSLFLTFHQLNANLTHTFNRTILRLLKSSLSQLRKYNQNKFFKEEVDGLFTCVTKEKSSSLLAQLVANQLNKLKKHNFFLKFLKDALKLFSRKPFSSIKGIKIKIKGRFNGALRAKRRVIAVGKAIPALTISSDINYSEETAFTSKGTFGVKVWVFGSKS